MMAEVAPKLQQVQQGQFNELRTIAKVRLGKLYKKIFNDQMMDFAEEVVFWIQARTQITSMAMLHLNYPTALLKYDFFRSPSTATVAIIHSVGTDEKYRQQGCSTSILQKIVKFVDGKSSPPEALFLEVSKENQSAINLYIKLDFRFVVDVHEKPQTTIFEGETFYVMKRNISTPPTRTDSSAVKSSEELKEESVVEKLC